MTAPRPRRLTHANLFVADMERSMDFYRSVIGLDESYRRTNLRAGFLTNGNSHHDIAVMEYGRLYAGKRDRRGPSVSTISPSRWKTIWNSTSGTARRSRPVPASIAPLITAIPIPDTALASKSGRNGTYAILEISR